MKRKMTFLVVIFALVTALLLPFGLNSIEIAESFVGDIINIKVYPPLLGGNRLASFSNSMNDSKGAEAQAPYYDIWSYHVNEPVTDALWAKYKDFWQFEVIFAKATKVAAQQPAVQIYIDLDGTAGGSCKSVGALAGKVQFDKKHPWDFVIVLQNGQAYIQSYDGSYRQNIIDAYNFANHKLVIRIPLNNPQLKKVLDMPVTYQYVFSYVPPTEKNKPYITDTVTATSPKIGPDSGFFTVYPLEVKKQNVPGVSQTLIEKYKVLADKEKARNKAAFNQELQDAPENSMQQAIAFYNLEQYQKAETIFDIILKSNDKNSKALAYKAVITAEKADNTLDAGKALRYIASAYDIFQKAENQVQNDDDRITVCQLRAEVSLELPESVFQKGEGAASDSIKAADLLKQKKSVNIQSVNGEYLKAAMGYKMAGDDDLADVYFTVLQNSNGLSDQIKYELAKYGYYPGKSID
jgi:tetratricopeptide (TPR) repeat protein